MIHVTMWGTLSILYYDGMTIFPYYQLSTMTHWLCGSTIMWWLWSWVLWVRDYQDNTMINATMMGSTIIHCLWSWVLWNGLLWWHYYNAITMHNGYYGLLLWKLTTMIRYYAEGCPLCMYNLLLLNYIVVNYYYWMYYSKKFPLRAHVGMGYYDLRARSIGR